MVVSEWIQGRKVFRDAPAATKDESAQDRFCDCGAECYQEWEVDGGILLVVVRVSVHAFCLGFCAIVLVGLEQSLV